MDQRPPRKKPSPATKAAPTDVDLALMESVVADTVAMTATAISRAGSIRGQLEMQAKELERELADFGGRRDLLRSQYENADIALQAREEDIAAALAMVRHGLNGGAGNNVVPMTRDGEAA